MHDVPDRYHDLIPQIERLERSSPQSYYIVVIASGGSAKNATRTYATALFNAWKSQPTSGGKRFDPDRSVIIVLALDDRQVALHAGDLLRDRWNLRGDTIDQELVRPAFIPLAVENEYPKALASLLDATNDWIAARDRSTPRVASLPPSPRKAADAGQTATARPSIALPGPGSERSGTEPKPPAQTRQVPPVPATTQPATGSLLMGLIIAAAMVFATIFGLVWLARRRVQNRVNARIKELKASSVEIMDRLDGLKERLKLLPSSDPDFKAPMTGATLALYEDIRGRVNTLWDRWLQIMDAIEKAQKLAGATVNPLGQKTLKDAESELEQKGVLEEIDRLSKACAADLDALNQAHESARASLAELSTLRAALDKSVASVSALGLPVEPYAQEITALSTAMTAAEVSLTPDPIGTAKTLAELHNQTETLRSRTTRVATLHGEAGQITAAFSALGRQIEGLRSGGLKLIEQDGNPDEPLAQSIKLHADALSALRIGDPEAAANQLESARARVQSARSIVESVQKAKAACERERTNRARETDRLRDALTQAESYQRELERDFAPESWQAVSRNLEQAKALLSTFDRRVQEAAEAASNTRQEYLAAARLYEQLAQQQQIVLRLMSGLGEQKNVLMALRTESRKVGAELSAGRKQLEIQIHQRDSIVSNATRQSLAAVDSAIDQATAHFADPRPDWPAIRRALADAAAELNEARTQVEVDIRNYDALTAEFESARQKADQVYTLLASQQADRIAANRLYRSAAAQLDQIGEELANLNSPAAALLDRLRGVVRDLDQAEQMANEDLRLSGQAEALIGEATRTIHELRALGSNGLMGNTANAENGVAQAEQLYQSQNYEQAIDAAASALEAARWSHQQAMQMAMSQQAAMAANQRRSSYNPGPSWGGISPGSIAAATAAAVLLEKMGMNAATAAPPMDTVLSEPAEAAPASDIEDTSLSSWSSPEESSQSQW